MPSVGIPIKNISQSLAGGAGSVCKRVRYNVRITDHISIDRIMAFPSDFPHTEVNTKSTIAVTGTAQIKESQVCVIAGKIM